MKQFEGKVAVVTGGSGGIGRATALAFAEKGAKVVIGDTFVDGGEETARLIRDGGGDALFVRTDVSNSSDVQSLINNAVTTFSRLDFAFNNAGIGGPNAPIADYPEDMWHKIIGVNLTGVWLCMKYEIPEMLKQGKGVIVNTSSAMGLTGLSLVGGYVAAKHGVVGLSKVAGMEYATRGIRVIAVCPGFVETPMMDEAAQIGGIPKEDFYKALGTFSAAKRVGKPEEVAEAVVWLCSDRASYVTGSALTVDGGWIAGYPLR